MNGAKAPIVVVVVFVIVFFRKDALVPRWACQRKCQITTEIMRNVDDDIQVFDLNRFGHCCVDLDVPFVPVRNIEIGLNGPRRN